MKNGIHERFFGCDSERGSIWDIDDRAPAHCRRASLSLNVNKNRFSSANPHKYWEFVVHKATN